MSQVLYNKLLLNLACSSRTGEYWPSVVFLRTSQCLIRTVTTSGQYSPVQPMRLDSKRLVNSTFVFPLHHLHNMLQYLTQCCHVTFQILNYTPLILQYGFPTDKYSSSSCSCLRYLSLWLKIPWNPTYKPWASINFIRLLGGLLTSGSLLAMGL